MSWMALQAGFLGLVGGSALLLGAMVGYMVALPQRLIAAIMAVGAGVLISAVAFDLMDEAYAKGGFDSAAIGFLAGAAAYTVANIIVTRSGAKHRKRSGSNPDQSQQSADAGSGMAIAVGALLDGIPESIVIGVSLLEGGGVSMAGRLLDAEMLVLADGKEQSWGDYGVHKCFSPGYRDVHSR